MTSNQLSVRVIILLAISAVFTTGCQTASFKKPDLSGLAFWKGKDTTTLPPPPARHFDPSQMEGTTPSQGLVGNSKNEPPKLDPLELNPLETHVAEAPSNGSQSRPRYSIDEEDEPSDSNSFALDASRIGSDFSGKDGPEGLLTNAQEDFQDAMNSATEGFDSTQQELQNQFDPIPGKVMNRGLEAGKNALDNTFDGARNSLNKAQEKSQELRQSLNAQMDDLASQANGFQESTRQKISNLSEKASQLINRPFPKFGGEAAKAEKSNQEIDAMRNELLEARAEYEALKRKIEANKAAKNSPSNQTMDSGNQAMQPRNPLGSQSEPTRFQGFQPSTPSASPRLEDNILRPQRTAPPASQMLRPQEERNAFPTTPHGSFGNQQSPSTTGGNIGQVGFESPDAKPTVGHASGLMPIGSSGAHSASRIQDHVDSIDIPEVILTGNSSYAPGSVKALKRR